MTVSDYGKNFCDTATLTLWFKMSSVASTGLWIDIIKDEYTKNGFIHQTTIYEVGEIPNLVDIEFDDDWSFYHFSNAVCVLASKSETDLIKLKMIFC